MEEIKVGEYVRTKIGDIYKIQNLNDYDFLRDKFYCLINKHSRNIIDLVQAGDVIRYKLKNLKHENLIEVKEYKDMKTGDKYLGVEGFSLEQIQILEILTKEQFARESYKVEE